MSHMNWTSSDALVLQALLLAAGETKTVELRSIIAAGDYLDHSILSREELATGLRKLYAIGFAEEKNGALGFTKKFRAVLKKSGALPKTIGKASIHLSNLLQQQELSAEAFAQATPPSAALLDAAYAAYS